MNSRNGLNMENGQIKSLLEITFGPGFYEDHYSKILSDLKNGKPLSSNQGVIIDKIRQEIFERYPEDLGGNPKLDHPDFRSGMLDSTPIPRESYNCLVRVWIGHKESSEPARY
jgi:hypothetical protein